MTVWQRLPVWARLVAVLVPLAVIALAPSSLQVFVINAATIGFVIAVVWAIGRRVTKPRRDHNE